MTSTFHGLEIGKRALYAQQTALSTTGHNIANANTTGYTRQRAEMQATNALSFPGMSASKAPGQLGTGVEVTKIVRLREDYLDVQLRGENKNLGYWEAKGDTLSKVEELLNEPSDSGLSYTLDQFWKGWQELAKNPDSAANRAIIQQKGVAVAETFNYISNSLDQIQADLTNVIDTKVNDVNSIAKQIGDLNEQIARIVPNGYQPNDLYDQRDVLLDQLSKLAGIKVTAGANSTVNVSIGNQLLVDGYNSNTLSVGYDDTTGLIDPAKITVGGNTVTLDQGELLGRIESYGILGGGTNSTIPSMKDKINQLARSFADAINTAHLNGVNLDQINGQPSTNVVFFTGDSAGNLAVNEEILNNLNLIAAAKPEANGQSSAGNGQNAQVIADLRLKPIDFNGATSTINDYYRNIIGQLGIDSQQAQRMKGNSDVIIQQVENRRQTVSGVSLDEEMTNMIKFQQAYNSAARVVTTMDECLDKIINGMGRVGL